MAPFTNMVQLSLLAPQNSAFVQGGMSRKVGIRELVSLKKITCLLKDCLVYTSLTFCFNDVERFQIWVRSRSCSSLVTWFYYHQNTCTKWIRFSEKILCVHISLAMMTSSNGDIFRVTGHLCGEFTGHRWIPHTKASDAELWCFLWSAPE